MKYMEVSFGNQSGKKVQCRSFCSGFTIGESYLVMIHGMANNFSNTHYFKMRNDSGEEVWVLASNFGFN